MKLFAALTLLAATTSLASAQTVRYATSFEPPTFVLGPFAGSTFSNGQDGWLATGDSTSSPNLNQLVVQSSVVSTGARAISIDTTAQPTSYAHIRRNTQFNVTANEPVLEIAFDMRLAQPTTTPSEWALQAQAGPGPGSGIFEWWIGVDGRLHLTSPSGDVPTAITFQRDRWYHAVTLVDYNAQTLRVLIDGQVAGTVGALSGVNWWFHGFTSLVFDQPGDDQLYVDDFTITTRDDASVASYCTAGTSTHGCVATLAASGMPSASATSGFTISASNVEGAISATLFYGISGRVTWPWAATSTSYLCVKSPTQRTLLANTGGTLASCNGTFSLDFLAFMTAQPTALGNPLSAGQVFDAQVWYRDPPAAKSTNLSGGLEFTLAP